MYTRCISYSKARQVHHAYCHDLYHLKRQTNNTGYALFTSTEFVYIQFALQWLYAALQFPLTQCAIQQCSHASTQFLSKRHLLVRTDTQITLYIGSKAHHPHTNTQLTHQAVGARSFTVQSGFIACDLMVILLAAIASFPIPWCPVVK